MINTPFRKSAIAALITAAVATGGLTGCLVETSGDTNQNGIQVQATASFNGRVYDANQTPVSGATVTLWANRAYTTTTDANGNYLIEVELGDVVAAPGGGSNETTTSSLNTNAATTETESGADIISRHFAVDIAHPSYADVRHVVDFEGTIGYTDGSGAVVLMEQTGGILPVTTLVPYVDNFSFTVYAGASPAAGAVVTLTEDGNTHSHSDNSVTDV